MTDSIDRKLWEKVPPIAVELTERENSMLQKLHDLLGEEFSFLTALKLLELMKKESE
jgi:hypothetical protein